MSGDFPTQSTLHRVLCHMRLFFSSLTRSQPFHACNDLYCCKAYSVKGVLSTGCIGLLRNVRRYGLDYQQLTRASGNFEKCRNKL